MRGMKKEHTMISLEDYVDFLLFQKHLPVISLNQIISMHGFKKIHKTQKKVLIDALETLDLMYPSRSTLTEPISGCASLDVQVILSDLNHLNWQDCCVASIQTLNSSTDESYGGCDFSIEPKSKTTAREEKKKKRVITGGDLNEGTWKLVPKRKRSGLVTPGGGGGGSGCSPASVSLRSC